MKPFAQYLAENERTYDYRIKICGDTANTENIKELKSKLDQFDPAKLSDVKTTPVQLTPTDFPNCKNDAVTMFDCSFRYPAIEPQIKQLWQLMGNDPNKIVMLTASHDDGLVAEYKRIGDENKDLIADTNYPADTAEQKALNKDHSADPFQHQVLKNAYRSDFTIAGGKTPAAKTTNDIPQGNKGPMYKVYRPARPATGAQPKG